MNKFYFSASKILLNNSSNLRKYILLGLGVTYYSFKYHLPKQYHSLCGQIKTEHMY